LLPDCVGVGRTNLDRDTSGSFCSAPDSPAIANRFSNTFDLFFDGGPERVGIDWPESPFGATLMRTAAGFLPLFGFAGVGVAGVGVLGGGVGGEGDLEDAIAREGADGVVGDPRKPAEDGLLVVEAFGTNLGFEPNCLFELFGGVLAEFLAAKISPCLFISNDPISNESGLGLPPLTLTTLFTLLFICGFGRRG